MNDAEKLAAARAHAVAIIAIIDATDGSGAGPIIVPPIPPTTPQPIPPSGDYPSGDNLKYILATLTREFNSNNATQNGMVGDPNTDLIAMFGGQTGGDYARLLQKVADANPLLTAAIWLRHGMTLDQVLMQNFAPAEQINDLVHVMQHYSLLPA